MSANAKTPSAFLDKIQSQNIHATCVDFNGRGVLLLGQSGTGKSDLALRLIDSAQQNKPLAQLVSDDQVLLTPSNKTLTASAPKPLQGLLEVRGVGICQFEFVAYSPIRLLVRLDKNVTSERLPDFSTQQESIAGIDIATMTLNPFELSAGLKIWHALKLIDQIEPV